MRIISRLKLPFRIKKNKLLFDLPIAQRLTLGFSVSIARTAHPETDNSFSENAHLYICVKDTGPGIPVEEILHLFQKFTRLQRNKSIRGTGLGLYLCKQLVESMGGRIWVESTGIAGEGSSFFFTLQKASPITDNPHPSMLRMKKFLYRLLKSKLIQYFKSTH